MNVSLTPQLELVIREMAASGRYGSASEGVGEALRLLEALERVRARRLEEVRRQAAEGVESPDRGEGLELDEAGMRAYLEEVNRRGRERLAAKEDVPGS